MLFDSPVICEYLNQLGGGKFFPGMSLWRQNSGRWKALGLQALGDGSGRRRGGLDLVWGAPSRFPKRRARASRQAVMAALDALERVKFAKDPTIGEISVACAIGYVEFRLTDLDWRASHPKSGGLVCEILRISVHEGHSADGA